MQQALQFCRLDVAHQTLSELPRSSEHVLFPRSLAPEEDQMGEALPADMLEVRE